MTELDRKYYEEMKSVVSPVDSSSHGHGCRCRACYEEWACSTGFETMNVEGRARIAKRRREQEAAECLNN